MDIKREKRLNSEFQREIYDVLKNRIKDPAITEMFSVSDVDVTSDLKHAKVYVSIFSTDAAKKTATFAAIKNSAKKVRSELGRTMRIRTVPEIYFILDDSAEYGQKIDRILSGITYAEEEGNENDD
ncbi:MAG: 30S ribosome-binding factor RbfA [Clostridia bacterium]|nr:30S ribosome-binding factor RbfA [Clostridia bacterium]